MTERRTRSAAGQAARTLKQILSRAEVLREVARSRRILRDVNVVGRFARVTSGQLVIVNQGTIELGERVRLMCEFGASDFRVGPGGTLRIGNRTAINYGTDIQVTNSVTIGDRVSIGPRTIITDSDSYLTEDSPVADGEPIVIEDDVWLASRVTVLPGAHIGAGSVITAGSVVSGAIPPRVVAGGSPIRVLRSLDGLPHDITPDETALMPPATRPATATATVNDPAVSFDGTSASTATTRLELGGLLISDFTIDPLAHSMRKIESPFRLSADIAPFGAVVPSLMAPSSERSNFAVVWTQPQGVLPSFRGLLEHAQDIDVGGVTDDVDRFADLIRKGLASYDAVFVPTWTLPPWQQGLGLVDTRPGGAQWALSVANARLMEQLASVANVYVLDAQRWTATVGASAFSERSWYLGKIPFDQQIFDLAAQQVSDGLATTRGGSRKLIVVDLDNTMWGGVVGDLGWQSIRLGGHDSAGEAFVDFQRELRGLQRRGVALAIASKNEESVALAAIDQHDAMVLRRDDFVGWRINWADKASNIAELVAELNLGLQSVVFIDDNPHERARVREALPEVLVPEWPEDPSEYGRALLSLRCFDVVATTDEDRTRTELYATEGRRQELRAELGTLDDWIRDLGVVVRAEPLDDANVARATQLLNKTNQMNLSTRRLAERDFAAWAAADGHSTWCVSVTDRLGDAGLTGILSVDSDGETATLVDFVLSCRVMGRRIEESMVFIAASMAVEMSATSLRATVQPTAKNLPCQRFFDDSAFTGDGDGVERSYSLDLTEPVSAPDVVTVALASDGATAG